MISARSATCRTAGRGTWAFEPKFAPSCSGRTAAGALGAALSVVPGWRPFCHGPLRVAVRKPSIMRSALMRGSDDAGWPVSIAEFSIWFVALSKPRVIASANTGSSIFNSKGHGIARGKGGSGECHGYQSECGTSVHDLPPCAYSKRSLAAANPLS
jgi:hypothetical protein